MDRTTEATHTERSGNTPSGRQATSEDEGPLDLLNVQRKALKEANGISGFAYFMEMGLGKTLTALAEFTRTVDEGRVTRLVVICPNSFKAGWVEEINKHNIDVDPYIFISGSSWNNDNFLKRRFERPPVLIVNYEAIRKEDTRKYITQFVQGRGAMIVLDESIQIKTYNSQQTKAALVLAPLFKIRRILSGKPVTQGPHDLWAQMKFIGAVTDKYFPFKTTFCKMGGFKAKKVVGTQNEELLAAKIDKYVFRASKAEWTDLPPKMYTSRQYELTPKLRHMYQSMEDDFVIWLNDTENVSVDAFITKYIKLAQIQSGFIIKEDQSVEDLVPVQDNPRFQLVREVVEEVNGKTIIPYVHRHTLNILLDTLNGLNPAVIRGNMRPEEIEWEKNKFNTDSNCRVILLQSKAGKYGHTLLGGPSASDRCSTMLFAENSYSLDDRSQIEDRMHRHGQTADHCLYIDLWGTQLDRRITQALQAKESIAQAVFQHFGKGHSSSL